MHIPKEPIEYYIVKMLLVSDTFLRTYYTKIAPELFSEKIRYIVSAIMIFYKKNNRILPRNILEDIIIPKMCKNDLDVIESVKIELDKILCIEVAESDIISSLKEDIEKFIKTRKILNAVGKAMPLLEENKNDSAIAILEEAFKLSFDESMGLDYWEDLESRSTRSKEISEVISTGMPSLDKLIGGGYRKKSLFAFAGPPNVGKTLILNDAASTLALNGQNVLYITLELTEDYVSQRTDAKIGEFCMNQLNVNPEVAIKKVMAKRDIMVKNGKKFGKLIYKNYSPNSISSTDIKAYIKNIESKKNIKFDFVIVDYLKLLKASGKVYGDNLYNKLGTVCEELRDIALTFNVCVLTASQTDRRSMNASEIGMDNISDSIAIVQTVDVLVTISRDETTDKQDMMRLACVKSRYSRNQGDIMAKVDYDFMKLVETNNTTSIHQTNLKNGKISVPKDVKDNTDEIFGDVNEV